MVLLEYARNGGSARDSGIDAGLRGKVYFTAASGQDILVLDVATDSYQIVQLTDAMIKMVAPKKTFGGAAVAEDRLIFPPFAVADVGILEHQS